MSALIETLNHWCEDCFVAASRQSAANIETVNHCGENFLSFAWPMLWQSSLLIVVVFALDYVLARKIRAAVRHALWLVVLVKLLLPPALALPTSATWWLWRPKPAPIIPVVNHYTVSFDQTPMPETFAPPSVSLVLPPPRLSNSGWAMLASGAISAGLLLWLLFRWRRVAGNVRRIPASSDFVPVLEEACQLARLRSRMRLKLIDDKQSPAVYGLFRPVILLPRALAERLSTKQLRAVLLHEAIHLRRGDVWVNCAQTLLQIAYWWHPLLWFANARIRRVREEAVDDAVMLALHQDADAYAPTLLEVARFAFRRPLASLGLIGILESRSALRQRVERLVDFRPPRKVGLTFLSLCGIFAFSAVALPMGQAPPADEKSASSPAPLDVATNTANQNIQVMSFVLETSISEKNLNKYLLEAGVKIPPTICIYLNNGCPLARGTTDQLDAVRRVVLKLNRGSSNAVEAASIVISNRAKAMPKAAELAREGQLAYEMGRLDEAESKLNQALALDPGNRGARYYLKLVHETQAPRQQKQALVQSDREHISNEISRIHLTVSYSEVPLNKVLQDLTDQSRQRDPDGKGIKFLFSLPEKGGMINPATGLPVPVPARPEIADPAAIKINLTLTNMSLAQVLNTICLVSDYPLKYSVENDAVVFAAAQYEMRTFKVNPNTFFVNLQNSFQFGPANIQISNSISALDMMAHIHKTSGGLLYVTAPNLTKDVSALAAQFFSSLGVNLNPPKTVYFNDRLGELFVYATPQDLDIIERAIQVLNEEPTMIHLKARFIEMPESFLADAEPNHIPAGISVGTGILTNPNFQFFLHEVEMQNRTEIAEPEVVTPSERHTEMRATIIQPLLIASFPP